MSKNDVACLYLTRCSLTHTEAVEFVHVVTVSIATDASLCKQMDISMNIDN